MIYLGIGGSFLAVVLVDAPVLILQNNKKSYNYLEMGLDDDPLHAHGIIKWDIYISEFIFLNFSLPILPKPED